MENRPGAGGIVAIEALVKAPADGHTMLFGSTGMYFQARVSRLEATIVMIARSGVATPVLEQPGKAAVESNETARSRSMRDAMGIPDAVTGREAALRLWKEDGPVWIREVQALNLPVD